MSLEKQIQEIKDFRDIGDKFKFMGVDMVVESVFRQEVYHGVFSFTFKNIPEIKAAYKDNSGVIRKATFSYKQLPRLIAENKGA